MGSRLLPVPSVQVTYPIWLLDTCVLPYYPYPPEGTFFLFLMQACTGRALARRLLHLSIDIIDADWIVAHRVHGETNCSSLGRIAEYVAVSGREGSCKAAEAPREHAVSGLLRNFPLRLYRRSDECAGPACRLFRVQLVQVIAPVLLTRCQERDHVELDTGGSQCAEGTQWRRKQHGTPHLARARRADTGGN